jgi:SAM-dependent methyltransferase
MGQMYEDSIREEFTHQSGAFARSAIMSAAETLGAVLELVPPDHGSRWLEVACGPGLIARALSARVGSVHGVDLTPAMVELAQQGAIEEGLENVTFSLGDAAALEFERSSFDGVLTRFSLHHIPAPQRIMAEMARVLRPGGWLIVADHVTDGDGDAAAWHQELERLRDPSHWACLTPERLRRFGSELGLTLDSEQLIDLNLDFDEWLSRGSGGPAAAALIERLLIEAPPAARSFMVFSEDGERRLGLRYWLGRWRLAGQS